MQGFQFLLPLFKEYRAFFVVILSIILVRIITVKLYKRRKGLKKKDNFVIGINNVTTILTGIWLFFFVLHLLGITLREFFTSITIIAAALAIIFKDYILNGLNGMIIMFGDNLHIGDYIVAGDDKGVIKNITLLNVQLKNDEDHFVIIPNNVLMNTTIINHTRNRKQNISLDFEVKTRLLLSVGKLEAAFRQVLENEDHHIKAENPVLTVVDLKQDLIHYKYRFGMLHYTYHEEQRIKQLLWEVLLELINGQNNNNWKKNEL